MSDSTENPSPEDQTSDQTHDQTVTSDPAALDFEPKPPYIPSQEVVDKLRALVSKRKEEMAERERLATMPRQPYVREEPRVGRNDPCPCGSGKKYKKCCMNKHEI